MANEILPITEAEVVLYQPDDNIKLDVRICNDTVWLTRQQMATLFGRDVKTIGKHINNALREELAVSVVAKNAITETNASTISKKRHFELIIQLSQNLRQLLPMAKYIRQSTTLLI